MWIFLFFLATARVFTTALLKILNDILALGMQWQTCLQYKWKNTWRENYLFFSKQFVYPLNI